MRQVLTRTGLAVGGCTALAALLRFPTLDAKSFWVDEVVTVTLVRRDFGSMLSMIPDSESTPPAYYILAWLWTQVGGFDEVGLRSLSAVLGTALVPVAYYAGRDLVSPRVGLASAALVAVNPLLIWYSQEGRAYMLLTFLSGLSLVFFARSLTGRGTGPLLLWGLFSALALTTHYFAVFLVLPQAVWLVHRRRPRRPAVLTVVAVGAVGLALLPIAAQQLENPRWIAESGLASRVAQIPAIFLVGFEVPLPYAFAAATGALIIAGYGLWLLVRRAGPSDRRGGLLAAGLGTVAVVLPASLAVVGLDYIVYKNVIVAVLPLAVAVASGLTAARAGRSGTIALSALLCLSAAIGFLTLWEPKYHREDWRRAADAIGANPAVGRVVVVTPLDGGLPLQLYLGASRQPTAGGNLRVTEIALVAGARRPLGSIANPSTPRPASPSAPTRAFHLVQRLEADRFTLLRYRSETPVLVSLERIQAMALDTGRSTLLLQRGPAP